ncbi:MAG: hypothetical protein ACREAA_11280, partial [Candidatus Polarisedimenticolia bacterium]
MIRTPRASLDPAASSEGALMAAALLACAEALAPREGPHDPEGRLAWAERGGAFGHAGVIDIREGLALSPG